MFDFGGVVDGYCSDFGRTSTAASRPQDYREAYEVMLAATRRDAPPPPPGRSRREVNAACRAPIEEAGLGEHFRHRMGHGIGMDVHERPFISTEDETPLEAGMTFTDEPSIIIPAASASGSRTSSSARSSGGRVLNDYPAALVATPET